MAEPTGYVDGPTRRPRKGGIKAVADFVPAERLVNLKEIDWTSEPCGFPLPAPGLCWGVQVAGTKSNTGPALLTSNMVFALYAGSECFLGGGIDHDKRARDVLEAGEDREIEAKLVAHLDVKDATKTTAATFALAVALAERDADNNYVGQPTIVMNRGDVNAPSNSRFIKVFDDGRLATKNGTPILASSKVPAGSLYITGQIIVWVGGDIVTTRVIHHINNREMALAERAYALGIDCDYVVAYTVTETL